jgi:hypothetical protein
MLGGKYWGIVKMADTAYAKSISYAEVRECRIERIFVKEFAQDEIRFSWWPNGRFAPRPLDVPEDHLLELMRASIKAGVFSSGFVDDLRKLLIESE